GRPDVAVANTSSVSVLLNRGDMLAPRVDYKVGPSPMSLVIADLNGDGTPDLATAAEEDSSSVLLNRGNGTFRRGHDYDSTSGPRSRRGPARGGFRRSRAPGRLRWLPAARALLPRPERQRA